jgi:hypothetical protein
MLPPDLNDMNTQMPIPQNMDQFSPSNREEENEKDQPLIAHFTKDEIKDLVEVMETLGVEEIINPETNLVDLRPLTAFMENPEIENAISQALAEEQTAKFAEGGEVEFGRPIAPELEELRQQGTGDDTELAIISPKLMNIFDKWNGSKPDLNPYTGLPQYGFLRSIGRILKPIARIAAPVIGGMLGGPAGAALASGITGKLMGDSWGKALGQAALGGAGAYFAPAIGGQFQGMFPGASSAMGGATRSVLGNNIGGQLGNFFTPAAGGSGVLGGLGGMATKAGMGQAAGQVAGNGGMGGMLSSLMGGGGNLLPLGAAGLMAFKGNQQEQKSLKEHDAWQRGEYERLRARGEEPWRKPKALNRKLRDDLRTPEEKAAGKQHQNFEDTPLDKIEYELKGGGAIRGIGKGQQDNIPKKIKQNSYIIDASSVSDIGDGSTDGGFKELDGFFSRVPSKSFNGKRKGVINALVSDGEYEVDPDKVTALGGGSNEKGAALLKSMIQQIRNQKRTTGNRLPPKAKPLNGYLSNLKTA